MSTDTKWIIGTVVGTGMAVITAVLTVAGLLLAQVASVNARIDDLDASVNARIDDVRSDMREMRASLERFDARLDAVEVALGKVDQRLLTIERVVLPPASDE